MTDYDTSDPERGITAEDLDECWCCGSLHDSFGALCPGCGDAGCKHFGGECQSDHIPVRPDGGTVETGECRVCGRTVPLDGEEAMERFGSPLCRNCTDEPVIFEADCTNQLCTWSYRREGDEFDRGHVEQLTRNQANTHQKSKRIFDDDPTHPTEVREVEPVTDGGTEGPNAGAHRYGEVVVDPPPECPSCGHWEIDEHLDHVECVMCGWVAGWEGKNVA